ncbi:MAG: ferredoxin family protein [Candidatus Lambdaproteobacteria bacterium]|nr:ferredoxin family protein [Candidatus Lambdaproteobacteria bacterium]
MTYVVTAYCDGCKYTDCVEVCPVEAFHEGPTMLYINPETCIDCDVCVAQCPVEAIYPEDQVPDKWVEYIQINANECANHPTISIKKDALPSARTLEEIKAAED